MNRLRSQNDGPGVCSKRPLEFLHRCPGPPRDEATTAVDVHNAVPRNIRGHELAMLEIPVGDVMQSHQRLGTFVDQVVTEVPTWFNKQEGASRESLDDLAKRWVARLWVSILFGQTLSWLHASTSTV